MRYFCYNDYDDDPSNSFATTVSEDDIRKGYYPYWYDRMCKKFGKEKVDSEYCFEDCLDDWMIVHWAWEVKE